MLIEVPGPKAAGTYNKVVVVVVRRYWILHVAVDHSRILTRWACSFCIDIAKCELTQTFGYILHVSIQIIECLKVPSATVFDFMECVLDQRSRLAKFIRNDISRAQE